MSQGKKLGVVGHVKNTSSGTVTGEVQGEPKPVSQMKVRRALEHATHCSFSVAGCLWIRHAYCGHSQEWLQEGPSAATVEKCSITNEKSKLDKLTYSDFEQR